MSAVRVSYIISTRNRAECLDRTLANVREFIAADDELLIMDGGSTDGTPQIVEKHRDIVTCFRSEPDCGEAHGFNKGLLAARGEWIKVLTDDDYIYPEGMRQAMAVLEGHPEVEGVICGGELFEPVGEAEESRLAEYGHLPPGLALAGSVLHVLQYAKCGLGLIFRRRLLSRAGLFDTTFRAVDTEYMARLVTCGAVVRYLDVKLYRHTTQPHSGVRNRTEMTRDIIRVLLRAGMWEYVLHHRDLPLPAVGDVLGVGKLRNGGRFLHIVQQLDQLRRTRRGAVLAVLGGWLRTCGGALAVYSRLKQWTAGPPAMDAPEPPRSDAGQPPAEPAWDGTLR